MSYFSSLFFFWYRNRTDAVSSAIFYLIFFLWPNQVNAIQYSFIAKKKTSKWLKHLRGKAIYFEWDSFFFLFDFILDAEHWAIEKKNKRNSQKTWQSKTKQSKANMTYRKIYKTFINRKFIAQNVSHELRAHQNPIKIEKYWIDRSTKPTEFTSFY